MKRTTGGFGQRPWYSRLLLGAGVSPLLLGGALMVGVLTGSVVTLTLYNSSEPSTPEAIGEEAQVGGRGVSAPSIEPGVEPALQEAARIDEAMEAAGLDRANPQAEPGGDDTLPAWRRFALAAPVPHGQPMIAVVIDDAGLDRRRSREVVDLPGPLTISFLAYARNLQAQAAEASAAGHELLVHVPMGPHNPDADPGPGVLLREMKEEELRERLDVALGKFEGYVGINNHMGSRFTEDEAGMKTVMSVLRSRGLLFLDSRTSGGSVGYDVAKDNDVPSVARDVFLDHDPTPEAVRASLAELETLAQRNGYAVGIGHPKDATIEVLREWIPLARERGFILVPISAVVSARVGSG